MDRIQIPLPDDYEGKVVATLFRVEAQAPSRGAVLYLHGYIDYFFQMHMARWFAWKGWDFYALELRKYGRSLLAGQHADYCRDLHEYYPEIDRSIDRIDEAGHGRIVLMGHSTGGLLAALYMSDGTRRERVDRLILNSPFFEFNTGWFKKRIAIPFVAALGRLFPYASKANELSPFYFDSVHRSARGEWDFDLAYKPREGIPLYFAWLGAIRRAHRRLRHGLGIRVPVLLMYSARSAWGAHWDEAFRHSDTVLDVADIRRYGAKLGDRVTTIEVEGGLHDLVLSEKPVRDRVLAAMTDWLDRKEEPSESVPCPMNG